ncbi:MAG: transglutaminase family protein [Planctomycetota bacterium]
MPNPHQLPALLKLLDDDSPAVRRAVVRQLTAFGESLEDELRRMAEPVDIDAAARRTLAEILADNHRRWFKSRWPACFAAGADAAVIESAQALIAAFQNGRKDATELGDRLDELAAAYRGQHAEADALSLARFLFQERGLTGAKQDYYGVRNSNLVWVIENRRGLPISLACIVMLVGHRLGLAIDGCNFPGHFLARARVADRIVLIDCFDSGKTIDAQSLLDSNPHATDAVTQIIERPPSAKVIMARVLRNLIRSYHDAHEEKDRKVMEDLLVSMVGSTARPGPSPGI